MSLTIEASRVLITDASGNERLDTDDAMFHITDSLSGSVSIAAGTATYTYNTDKYVPFNRTQTYSLGSCHPSANHVRGAIKISFGGGSYGLPGFGWFAIGGTYVHVFDTFTFDIGGFQRGSIPKQIATYNFVASGGAVTLNEIVSLGADGGSGFSGQYTMLAFTLEYKLKIGLFT